MDNIGKILRSILCPGIKTERFSEEQLAKIKHYCESRFSSVEKELEMELARELLKYLSDEVAETTNLIQWYLVLYGGTWLLLVQSFKVLNDSFPKVIIASHVFFLFAASILGVILRHRAWQFKLNTDIQKQLAFKADEVSAKYNGKIWEITNSLAGTGVFCGNLNYDLALENAMHRILPDKYTERLKKRRKKRGNLDIRVTRFHQITRIKRMTNISILCYFIALAVVALSAVLRLFGCI